MANIILSKDDCLKQLYSRGNICLTESKMINVDAKYRPFLALFSDYTFLVNETAKTDRTLNEIILKFRVNYSTNYELKGLKKEMVPIGRFELPTCPLRMGCSTN